MVLKFVRHVVKPSFNYQIEKQNIFVYLKIKQLLTHLHTIFSSLDLFDLYVMFTLTRAEKTQKRRRPIGCRPFFMI